MLRVAVLMSCLIASPVLAQSSPDGTLNPEEMSLNSVLQRALHGEVDMVTCAQGYFITKSGHHEKARVLFERCAEAGYTGTMTWMAQLDDNGLGAPEDAAAAAAWDRRAAEAGDPVGQFNYGLDLLRGRGVDQDISLGRHYVDRAAAAGLKAARHLQEANYDLDSATPDADNWRYQHLF